MVQKYPNIDLSYRPQTYWPVSLTQEQLISRIKGDARQKIARGILQTEGFPGLNEFLAREELSKEEREIWGGIHPTFLGGEFLPVMLDGEVEIVRISLNSTTNDQISVRACKKGKIISYRVVGEYEEDMSYDLPFDNSEMPLTLGELVKLMDGTNLPDDIFSGGLVVANWECGFEGNSDVEEAIRFVTIKSNFYSQLNEYYEIFSETWKEEHKFDDDYDE